MPTIGVSCERGKQTHASCDACMLQPLRPCHYTPDMLVKLRHTDELGALAATPSRLQGCDRQAVLQSRHDYYIDIDNAYVMYRGNMFHALMEQAAYPAVTVIRERRLTTQLRTKDGVRDFSGKADAIVVTHIDKGVASVKIIDYKSKSEISHDLDTAAREHQIQINLYRWLVMNCISAEELGCDDFSVDELEIVYADMKKTRRFSSVASIPYNGKLLSRKEHTYEVHNTSLIKVKTLDWCEAYIKRRMEERERAMITLPTVLPEDEQWKCRNCNVVGICGVFHA